MSLYTALAATAAAAASAGAAAVGRKLIMISLKSDPTDIISRTQKVGDLSRIHDHFTTVGYALEKTRNEEV